MSYLSLIDTKDLIRRGDFRRYFDNAVSRHRLVMSLFPDNLVGGRSESKILFRFEKDKRGSRCLIRSSIKPLDNDKLRTFEESLNGLEESRYVSFRVTLNPIERNKKTDRVVVGLEEKETWLLNKLSEVFEEVEVIDSNTHILKRSAEGKNLIDLTQFDGVAKIKNLEELLKVLENGLGRSKNYGSGLLTVRLI